MTIRNMELQFYLVFFNTMATTFAFVAGTQLSAMFSLSNDPYKQYPHEVLNVVSTI